MGKVDSFSAQILRSGDGKTGEPRRATGRFVFVLFTARVGGTLTLGMRQVRRKLWISQVR